MTHESHYSWIDTRLGRLLLMAQSERLCGAWFDGQRYAPIIGDDWEPRDDSNFLREVAAQLRAYFDGVRQTFDLPLAPSGTPFQKSVWKAIAAIPYGDTATYAQLATRAGRPQAARAAGAATGR
ncbi:MAG TPA: methylated-DNA--[protein]-cysteine S-methyltransferase, partial [Casimicrobiaceae bacterium]|nr:methylated-DNA--[protein]-cysteine S-methyltransferase [Casimicrobiaceae bacterium]